MRWKRGYQSRDVEVRRGGGGPALSGMAGGLLGLATRRFGWMGALLVIGAIFLFNQFGGSVSEDTPANRVATEQGGTADDPRVSFASFVLDDIQETWTQIFRQSGENYPRAKLVLFTDATQTGCGYGQSATGPFYCPLDRQVYLDLGFFRELDQRLGAPGDFAQAYVIAHEVGHHVQNLAGTMDRAQGGAGARAKGANSASVKLELQADCYAGVWAKASEKRDLLEVGDIDEAIGAAQAVGDDRLQSQATGRVQPESWTHGSAQQRAEWFRRGYASGDPGACDTFESTASR